MKQLQLLITGLVCLSFVWQTAQAQSLDPAFAPPSVFAPALVHSAVEQPDGKRVITGVFSEINDTAAFAISRLNANGSLDVAFQQNVGAASNPLRIRLLSNGQFLLTSPAPTSTPVIAGGISRQGLLRLNADGTGDASFDIGTAPDGYIEDFLPLPNGQLIAGGDFDHFNGTPVAHGLVRLTATGAIDPTFNAGLGLGMGGRPGGSVLSIVGLPNGQLLIGGYFTSYDGHACEGLARLNADGSFDPTFVQALDAGSDIPNIVVQPDGKILLAGFLPLPNGTFQSVIRLLPNGAYDNSFTPPPTYAGTVYAYYAGDALQLQPDGKIVLINQTGYAPPGFPGVARLNADGTQDPSFQVGAGPNYMPRSVTLLASGKLLIAGNFTNFSGTLDRTLVQLTSTGALDPSFLPIIRTNGTVTSLVRQTDGKLLAGGNFSKINGQSIRRLARFNIDGTLDATFQSNTVFDGTIASLALQPDGRLLATDGGLVRRYLPDGSPDNSLTALDFDGSILTSLLLQPDGRILVGGLEVNLNGNAIPPGLLRLLPDGTPDATFAPSPNGPGSFTGVRALALQPNGKLVVAGFFNPVNGGNPATSIMRLESSGALDASFAGRVFGPGFSPFLTNIAIHPTGKILVSGRFSQYDGVSCSNLIRLNTDGSLDTNFTPPVTTGIVYTMLFQPNNRVLVGGEFTSPGLPTNLLRLLPDGPADASFGATTVPNSTVRSLLIQPDGRMVVGGSFSTISGQSSMALARIAASNVLHVAAPQAVADRTAAWPVPASTSLHVAPDPAAHPQTLELLDVLGRSILHQALTGGSTATLAVETLPVGTYLLRVTYTEGTVTRRIQIQ